MGVRDLKVKSKLEMKYFKGKMTGVFYILVWRGHQEIANCRFHCRDCKVLVEDISQEQTWFLYVLELRSVLVVSSTVVFRGYNAESMVPL